MIISLIIIFVVGTIIWRLRNLTIQEIVRDLRLTYRAPKVYLTVFYTWSFGITVDKLFDNSVKKYPNKILFYFQDEKWTFQEVQQKSNQIANYLQKEGYRKGDKIAIIMSNRPEYICLWIGMAKIGVVAVFINYNLRSKSLQHCLKAGSCKAIIYDHEFTATIQELKENDLLDVNYTLYIFSSHNSHVMPNELNSVDLASSLKVCSKKLPLLKERIKYEDDLFYIYTSGTTGLPKAAVIKHSKFILGSTSGHIIPGRLEDDIIYISLPFYHSNATLCGIGPALQYGSTIVLSKNFSASRFWTDCIKHNATVFLYIGEVCRYLLAQPVKPEDKQHKIRLIFGNGLRTEIWKEFITRFNIPNVAEFYGSTEGNCNMINIDNIVGAVGHFPNYMQRFFKIYIVKVDEYTGDIIRDPKTGLAVQCRPNEPGELVATIQQNSLVHHFGGYTDPEAKKNKEAVDIVKKGDKVFRSGDILVRDGNGYFYFKDRQGDTFRWKGENVATTEVENIISTACGLRATAVYGVEIPGADGRAGMVAIVDPEFTLDLNLLAEKLSTLLPAYANPLFLRLLKEMDVTGTYKVRKINLQKDGYDITKIKDPIYFSLPKSSKFVKLDSYLYNSIINGKVRV